MCVWWDHRVLIRTGCGKENMKEIYRENLDLKDGEGRWLELEFKNLHNELTARIIYLYKTINLAIIFWVIFLLAFFGMQILGVEKKIIYTFLLIIPVIFDLVAFVYQTNQNSLESIANYFHKRIKPQLDKKYKSNMLQWEKFFAEQKRPFRYESITKVFPFILPSIIPIYLLTAKYPLEQYQIVIAIIDIVLLIIVLENFRYKFRRVR